MRVERLESHQPEEQKCKEYPYSIKNKLYVIKPRQKKAHTKNARAKLVFQHADIRPSLCCFNNQLRF